MARKEVHARSENISLGGILLSSAFLIPEGTMVEVAVGVDHTPDPGILLNARGKVLRVQPQATGDFAVAIKLDRSFELPLPRPELRRSAAAGAAASAQQSSDPEKSGPTVHGRGFSRAAWHTET